MNKTPNQMILEQLKTAPDSQVSPLVRQKVSECDASNPAAIKDLFQWIFDQSVMERSAFVQQLVNPQFTHLPSYSEAGEPKKKSG